MNIFLTGGTGMLGEAILRMATRSGLQHTIISPTRHELDLTDRCAVRKFYQDHNFDLVIHCAAKVGGIQANISDPVGFLTENILISTHVIYEANLAGVSSLLNIGSSCMYPRNPEGLLREENILDAPLEPTNEAYALAKISSAKLCEAISNQYGLAYRTFIPCNLYGEGDKFDVVNGHMIASAIAKIYKAHCAGDSDVEIWGDGSARREFLYVDDIADFIIQKVDFLSELPLMLNIGLGKDYTVNEYFRTVADVIGFKGNFVHNLSAPVGMSHKLMDITKARLCGWSVKTDLCDGIEKSYHAYCESMKRDVAE